MSKKCGYSKRVNIPCHYNEGIEEEKERTKKACTRRDFFSA